MKVTSDTQEQRGDGWYLHLGKWEEVTVGTVLADPDPKKPARWEVIDTRMVEPVYLGNTLWIRVRDQISGAEATIPPKPKWRSVTIITPSPLDTQTPPPTPPSDADAIWAVIEGLGATMLGRRDDKTGEITCPNDPMTGQEGPYDWDRAQRQHVEMAHGVRPASGGSVEDLMELHNQCHNPRYPEIGKTGGFAHRHVPEDLSIFTGRRL